MLIASLAALAAASASGPIAQHPTNPRIFAYKGKPTVLVTSAEHYGGVLNLGMDARRYLAALKVDGLNYTRVFSGAYCESPADFGIRHNTLAPEAGKLICPWARSTTDGYANGGSKFDLTRWDQAYFARLHAFVGEARKQGIIVEMALFCPFYGDTMWNLSPMKAANNVNGVGTCGREEVYALKEEALTRVQEALTRKLTREMNRHDNLFFEICNEPYFGGVTLEWQRRISAAIADEESRLPKKHLIAQNIANGSARVTDPDANVRVLNFHYTSPPVAVAENADLKRIVTCDETGFQGTADEPYRRQGWAFMLSGGGMYNNLDYSFTVAHPDGTATVEDPTPGGGGPGFRKQMATLLRFMNALDLAAVAPDGSWLKPVDAAAQAYALARPGAQYAAYVCGGNGGGLTVTLPEGKYRVRWTQPLTGVVTDRACTSTGAALQITPPDYPGEAAVLVTPKRG
jgi:hypothetical protein